MKEHILVVEDEAIIYERLRKKLSDHNYSVDDYCPSVASAIACINTKRPDLVLLDINLEGELTGLDLGKMLDEDYKIPFIYVTQFGDDHTFYKGLSTNHAEFVVKTKPRLDITELMRKIQTALNSYQKKNPKQPIKESILAYVDYVQKTKNLGNSQVSQVPIPFKDIAFFTTNSIEKDEEKSKERKKTVYKKLDRNNTRVCTWDNKSFIVPDNLAPIYKTLPYNFVRISEDYIVNIGNEILDGRINGKRLKIRNEVFSISERYKDEVEIRLKFFYG